MHTAEKEAERLVQKEKENKLSRQDLRKLRVVRALTLKSAFDIYTVHAWLSDCILRIISFGCVTRY